MVAHGSWAQMLMLAGAAELGRRAGKLPARSGGSRRGRPRSCPGPRSSCTSRTRGSSPARRSSTTDRLDAIVASLFPFVPGVPAALVVAGVGLRDVVRRSRRAALLRPRLGADLRPPLASSPECRTGETRAARSPLLAALALPAAAFAHASLRKETPPSGSGSRCADVRSRSQFDQTVTSSRRRSRSSTLDRQERRRHASRGSRRSARSSRRCRELPTGAVHGALARALGRRARRLRRLDVRRPGAAPPPTDAYGAQGPTRTEHIVRWLYFLALALAVGSLGFRLLSRAARFLPRVERRLFSSRRSASSACSRSGSRLLPALRGRAAAAVLEVPLRRPLADRAGTRFGQAFVVMTLGFALVAALIYLAWLSIAHVVPVGARSRSASLRLGAVALGPLGGRRRRSWQTELADWVHLSAATLWLGGLVALAVVGLARRGRSCAATAFLPLLAARDRAGRASCSRAGTYLGDRAAAARPRPLDDGLRRGAARQDRARRRSRSPGARSTTSSSGRRSQRRGRRRARVGAELLGESVVAWPCCSLRRSSSTRSRRRSRRRGPVAAHDSRR